MPFGSSEPISLASLNKKKTTCQDKINLNWKIVENIILSTCNRVEIYARVENTDQGIQLLKDFICDYHGLSRGSLDQYFYSYRDNQAIEHLFRVSSSLDSMILGEAQILGQVKDAYSTARALSASGLVLNQLFEKAFNVAKKVRE